MEFQMLNYSDFMLFSVINYILAFCCGLFIGYSNGKEGGVWVITLVMWFLVLVPVCYGLLYWLYLTLISG